MDELLKQPLRGYKKIVRLGEKVEKQIHSLYKYMNVQRAIEFLESGNYYFVEPKVWADPYEKRFYTADYSQIGFKPKQCFCTCLTHNISSEAAWKMYRNNNGGLADRTIRFEFNRKILFKALEDSINIERIYFGNANYAYTTKDINKLHIPDERGYEKYFSDIDEEKFLHLLLIKRRAFIYESEIRLFILPEHRETVYPDEDVKVSTSLIIHFTKEQMESMIKSISIDPSCSDIECDMIKTKIGKLFPNIKCEKNGLYNTKPRLIVK